MRNIQILGTLILCLCSLLLVPNQIYSQSSSKMSALEVVVDESSNAYFNINFEKGATLYSICKQFQIATTDAMMLNEIVNPDQISIGEQLLLPLNKEFFRVKKPTGSGFIPVYYVVKKQETLFRISKVYFAQDVKDMIERNKLSGFTLSIDQKLLVGYYQTNGINSTLADQVVVSTPIKKPTTKVVPNVEKVIERPAVSAPSTIVETTNKPNNNNEYVLVDNNVKTPSNIAAGKATGNLETVGQSPEIIEVPSGSQEKVEAAAAAAPPQDRIVINKETGVVLEEKSQSKEAVQNVPEVVTVKSKPTLKERFKKVIGSDKLDHSISENKYDQIKAEMDTENVEVITESTVDTIQVEPKIIKPTSNLASQSKKGIAYWDKKGKDYENLMVLHKSAEVNTLIKLTNPVNGLSTFARVVGKIPENAFKKDIDVVLSPAVARKIGAIDSRMQIAMTYQIIKP